MTDNDIIKCLRHCNGGDCETCKALGTCDATWRFHKATLDLINRQKAEIERFKEELEETQEKLEILLCEATGGMLSKYSYSSEVMTRYAHEHILKCCEDERAEAVKEFAERLKGFSRRMYPLFDEPIIDCKDLDNLVKEMVGEG